MKILVSWSSGKDSAWMLHTLREQHGEAVAGLLTTVNTTFDRVAMHAVRRSLLDAQAAAIGLPLDVIELPWPCANADYEQHMGRAVQRARANGFTHVAFGDLFLEDVRQYREDRLAGTGLTPLFPLWKGQPTGHLAREIIDAGVRAYLTCVDPRKLPASFAGRAFDATLLAELPRDVDPCGEHGEFHTFVWDGPMFARPLPVRIGDIVHRDGFVFADVQMAETAAGDSPRSEGLSPVHESPLLGSGGYGPSGDHGTIISTSGEGSLAPQTPIARRRTK
jgi:uncharacterized protein (TIGR00290 family)